MERPRLKLGIAHNQAPARDVLIEFKRALSRKLAVFKKYLTKSDSNSDWNCR